MKVAVFVSLSIAILSSPLVYCQPKTAESKTAQQVRRTDDKFHNAVRTADVTTLERLLSDQFIWTHSTGNVQDKALVVENLRSGKLRYEILTTDDVKVYVYGRSAVVSGHSDRKYPDKDPFQLRYTAFYVKTKAGWQVAAFHTSIFPK